MGTTISDITRLLQRCRDGDAESAGLVFAQLYSELRKIAVGKLSRSGHGDAGFGNTVTPTVLVHEVYLRLTSGRALDVESRRHFYTTAAKAMQHFLVDRARRVLATKRGGDLQRVTWTERWSESRSYEEEVLDLEQAMDELGELSKRGRRVVELRFFAGLTAEETAEILEVSERSVHREWQRARAFLHARLAETA